MINKIKKSISIILVLTSTASFALDKEVNKVDYSGDKPTNYTPTYSNPSARPTNSFSNLMFGQADIRFTAN